MHQAAGVGIEGIATVQGAAVVPHHEVADLPYLAESELGLRRMRPELVEELLAFVERHADDPAVPAPAEEQTLASGLGMPLDQRVARARRFAGIGHVLVAF